MEKELHIGVKDVYDIAADIGKEFQKVIEVVGTDLIHELMRKVIETLEYLEGSSVLNESFQLQLSELRTRVSQLEFEKIEKAEIRHKLDLELEEIEDNWRKETGQLSELVTRLQEENQRLSNSLAEKENYLPLKCRSCLSDQDLKVVQRLKEVAEKQREQLQLKDNEIAQKSNEVENLQQELEQQAQLIRDMNHRMRYLKTQTHTLNEEKTDLQAQIQNQKVELVSVQKHLNATVKDNMDLVRAENLLVPDLKGKLLIDLDDPNRPRFTLDELRHILFERNDLKAKISDLEDELNVFRPKSNSPGESSNMKDLPVQGPINKEPDEKLYPERKFRIRRFFPSLIWPRLTQP